MKNMSQEKSKLQALKKRRIRVEKEVANAKKKQKEQEAIIQTKTDELKVIEADIVAALLVMNGWTLEELTEFLETGNATTNSLRGVED